MMGQASIFAAAGLYFNQSSLRLFTNESSQEQQVISPESGGADCLTTPEDPFYGLRVLRDNTCSNSIDEMIREDRRELSTFQIDVEDPGVQLSLKEGFCNRFRDEVVALDACYEFDVDSDELLSFKRACARELHTIEAQDDISYHQSFERLRNSHTQELSNIVKRYRDLSQDQANLLGELMSYQDNATARRGMVCLPDRGLDQLTCASRGPHNINFNNYLGLGDAECALDPEACHYLASIENGQQQAGTEFREISVEMARTVTPRFREQLNELFNGEEEVSSDEFFNAYQRTTIDTLIKTDLNLRDDQDPLYQQNAELLSTHFSSLDSIDNLESLIENRDPTILEDCPNCNSVEEYLFNQLNFGTMISRDQEERVVTDDQKRQVVSKVMNFLEHVNNKEDDIREDYKALSLINRMMNNSNAQVDENELREAGLLEHGFIEALMSAGNNDDITGHSSAFRAVIDQAIEELRERHGDDFTPDIFQIYAGINRIHSNESRNACGAIQEELENLCDAISYNYPILSEEDAAQCLDFAFNDEYRSHLMDNLWGDRTEAQKNGSYYELVGLSCIVAQRAFDKNDTEIDMYRRIMNGEETDGILADLTDGAVGDNASAEKVRGITLSESERLTERTEVPPEESSFFDGLSDSIPSVNDIQIGGKRSEAIAPMTGSSGGMAAGKLGSNNGNNQAAMGQAGMLSGNNMTNGTGIPGINQAVQSLPEELQGRIDQTDPVQRGYLDRISELQESLQRLEQQMASATNGEQEGEGETGEDPALVALREQMAREQAEIEQLREELESRVNEREQAAAPTPQNINVEMGTNGNTVATTTGPSSQPDQPEEEVTPTETFSPIAAPTRSPGSGGGTYIESPVDGAEVYDGGALALTARIEEFGEPVEKTYAEIADSIVSWVNVSLLEENEPVYRNMGDSRFLQYTLLPNGELQIRNVVLRNGTVNPISDEITLETEADPDDEIIRHRRFQDL